MSHKCEDVHQLLLIACLKPKMVVGRSQKVSAIENDFHRPKEHFLHIFYLPVFFLVCKQLSVNDICMLQNSTPTLNHELSLSKVCD